VSILVIGGRSKIGAALLADLVGKGNRVRALLRSGEAASSLPTGVDAVVSDLARPDSLRGAMDGVERVFLLSSPHRDAVRWHRNAIDVAREAGVGLLVRSSILGAGQPSPAELIDAHAQSDRYLEQAGIPNVILRPNLFLQNVPESTIPSIDDEGRFFVNAGEARISMVDTSDVAAVASVVLTEDGHAGARYDITGPEALSYADVAAKLTASLGRQIAYVPAPDEAVRTALLGFGLDQWFVGALVGIYQDYRRSGTDGYASAVTDTVQRLTGAPPRSLDALLAQR